MAKNQDYFQADTVKLEEVSFRIVKDPNTAVNLYETGEVDMSGLSGEQIEQYAEHPHLTSVPGHAVFYLELNQEDAVFANLNARKAFAYAIDKSFITDEILANGSIVADYLVPYRLAFGPDGKDFRETTGTYNAYDKAKAAEYWATAKEELGQDTFEIELLVGDSETTGRIAEYIQAQIAANLDGCTLTINQQPFKNRLQLTREKKFSAVMSGWGPDYGDPMTFLDLFTTTSPFNKSGYSSEDYDTIIERCQKGDLTTDLATRWTELQRAEKILIEQDAAVLPLWQRGLKVLQQPKIKGLERHAFAPDIAYWGIEITE
jgi:oligopeptide transport system substrate-binding protein